jgi:hypothetical protein
MALFPARYTRTRDIGGVVVWYLGAKALEMNDGLVYRALGGAMAGHALKHLAAAMAMAVLVAMVAKREPLR